MVISGTCRQLMHNFVQKFETESLYPIISYLARKNRISYDKDMKTRGCKKYLLHLWCFGYSSIAILSAIFLIVFVIPMAAERHIGISIAAEGVALFLLIAGVFSVTCGIFVRSIAMISIAAAVMVRLMRVFIHHEYLNVIEILLAILLLSVFAFLMVRQFLTKESPIRDRLIGAVAIYLLIGIIFARIYQLLYIVNPAAFHIMHFEGFPTLVYYSFVTLVTIGYGDIFPISLVARNLAILEGVMGQLYVVILISALVSEKVAGSAKNLLK